MQAMMKKFLVLAVLLVLASCQTSGSQSSWNRPGYEGGQAQTGPSKLTREAMNAQVYSPYVPPGGESVPAQQRPALQNGFDAMVSATAAGANLPAPAPLPSGMYDLPPVKVALLLPLSGEHSDLGQAMLQAAQLALFDMGYKAFELMPRDTKGKPADAANAAQAAIAEGAQLILGPVFASEVRAVKPVAAQRRINVIAFSTDWTLAGGNTFIMGFLPFGQVERVAEYASSNGIRNIAILAPENAYGNAVISAFNGQAYRSGARATNIVKYTPGNREEASALIRTFSNYDQRSKYMENRRLPLEARLKANPKDKAALEELKQIGKEASANLPFDAILLPVGGEEAREISSLLNFYELEPDTVKRLGTGLWDDQVLATDTSLAGAWFAAPSPDLRRDFEIRYRDLYGMGAQRLATLAYDATALAAVLAKKGFQERGKPAYEHGDLTNPNGFAGIDGIFRFHQNGTVERGLAVLEYRRGDIKVLSPSPTTFERMDY